MSQARKNSQDWKAKLWTQAQAAGFCAMGVTTPVAIAGAERRLRNFLAEGRHGEMAWLAKRVSQRANPKLLWPGVRSIVMLGMNYAPQANPLDELAQTSRGYVSVYARGGDYHSLMKRRLKRVAGWLHRETGAEVKVFVDTAPVMEKPLAAAAGLGWQGKHTNLVSRAHGSWLFLGAIYTSQALPADTPHPDHCGSCQRCLEACPTGAITAPYQLDARLCLSYLTIEHKGPIPTHLRKAMGNHVFGCDICLAVCPWNRFAHRTEEARFAPRPAVTNPPLQDLLSLDEATFQNRFSGTAVKRAGWEGLLRNALIAAGNSGDISLRPAVQRLLTHETALIRATAVWAMAQLTTAPEFAALEARHLVTERDPSVRKAWAEAEAEIGGKDP